MQAKTFPGTAGKFFNSRHPAIKLSQQAKNLRIKGIGSIVVDCIYRVPEKHLTAVVFFPPIGSSLQFLCNGPKENFPVSALASFFAELHKKGIQLSNIQTDKLLFSENGFSIANPEDVKFFPSSLSNMERCNNMLDLLSQLQLTKAELMNLCHYYAIESKLQENKDFMKKFSKVRDICFNSRNSSGHM